jgi:HEAT repeat protein
MGRMDYRFVRVVVIIGLAWLAVTVVRDRLTAQRRFVAKLDAEVQRLRQSGEQRVALPAIERDRYAALLRCRDETARWQAAGDLAGWRDGTVVPALVSAMQDDAGTRRTCVIAQSLGAIGDAAAVPALLEAIHHPRNLDLRVCATHALAQIGDARAVAPLLAKVKNRNLREDDRVSALLALGDLGLPEALPVLQEIAGNDPDPQLRSLATASVRKIEMLRAPDPVTTLLGALDETPAWTSDEWVLNELAKRWDNRVATALNQYVLRNRAGAIRAAALLLHHRALRAETNEALARSANKQHQWLAAYARAGRDSVTLARTTP